MFSFKLADESMLVVVSRAADCSRTACRCVDACERGANDSLIWSNSCCRSLTSRPDIGLYGSRSKNNGGKLTVVALSDSVPRPPSLGGIGNLFPVIVVSD
jgi:hypothetical protein